MDRPPMSPLGPQGSMCPARWALSHISSCYCYACVARQIFNGRSVNSPSLGRYCGTTLPRNVRPSASNYLTVQFVSNSDGQTSTGFSFNYTRVLVGCGGSVQLSGDRPTALITSPNYPNNYPHSVDCTWTVSAPADHKVQLLFTGDIFNIEPHRKCALSLIIFILLQLQLI